MLYYPENSLKNILRNQRTCSNKNLVCFILRTFKIIYWETFLQLYFKTICLIRPGAVEKEGTADNTSRNEIRRAHTTQNSHCRHWLKSMCLSIKSDM